MAAARALGLDAGAATLDSPTLEVLRPPPGPPRLEDARPLEASTSPRAVRPGVADFHGFLDGIQRSRLVGYAGIVPIVHATVAAAIRVRDDRTLRAWGDGAVISRAIYLPAAMVPVGPADALRDAGFDVIDTTPEPAGTLHPEELLGAARVLVQRRREVAEAALADAWCRSEAAPLYVDGGIGGFAEASRHRDIVGVIKSHRTVYGATPDVGALAALRPMERSPAFSVATRGRSQVASWYLRLRDSLGDPFGALVRIEIAEASFSPERADAVSGWVLAEREPAALPDPRWRVMAYGIRECEEYLRAVTG